MAEKNDGTPPGQGGDTGRRHPGLEEAWRSSEPGPGALVAFLAAGALLLVAVLVGVLTWAAATLGVPIFLAMPVVVALLFGGFTLLRRSVKD